MDSNKKQEEMREFKETLRLGFIYFWVLFMLLFFAMVIPARIMDKGSEAETSAATLTVAVPETDAETSVPAVLVTEAVTETAPMTEPSAETMAAPVVVQTPETKAETEAEPDLYISGEGIYSGISVSTYDIELMARVVYLEARGEPYRGQVAVAEVVLNRVLSEYYPDNVHDVIYQRGQFTSARSVRYTTPGEIQYNAVYAALAGEGPLYNTSVVYFSVGSCGGTYYTTIGNHVFGTIN